jgi:hypothetical protein
MGELVAKGARSGFAGGTPPDPRDYEEFAAWLREQPREWSVVIALRAAMRVLPLISIAGRERKDAGLSLFRAAAIARFAAKFPGRIVAARGAAASGALIVGFAFQETRAANVAVTRAARAIRDAADADVGAVAYGAARAIHDAARAAGDTADHVFLSTTDDAVRLQKRSVTPAQLAGAALWPKTPPVQLVDAWRDLAAALREKGDHWAVWTDWYNRSLAGLPSAEVEDATLADITNEFRWDRGAEEVNAQIATRLEALRPDPAPIQGIPSPIAISLQADGRIGAGPGDLSSPTLPEALTREDHVRALAACRSRAEQLHKFTMSPHFQGRADYALTLGSYLEWLPAGPNVGNILLADGEARVLNKLFSADESILASGFASRLAVFLEDHIALRPFYPEIERHYHAVRTGRLVTPLSRDAVELLRGVIHAQTPNVFHESVSPTIDAVAKPVPDAKPPSLEDTPPADPGRPKPPSDPIAEVDPQESRSFIVASALNRIWGILQKGKDTSDGIEGWKKTYEQFKPHIGTIIDWLSVFWPGGGSPPPPPTMGV